MILFRLTTRDRVTEAFNGLGASKYGGRWNSVGTKMVYCSQSASLAILENLVHFDSDILPPLFLYQVEIRDSQMATLPDQDLESQEDCKKTGDQFIAMGNTLALKVPSIIVPTEYNILLNPAHPDFSALTIQEKGEFTLDHRLI